VTVADQRIRDERPTDLGAIRAVNLAAFDRREEADLVDALRMRAAPIVSMVAEVEGAIAGHIMFSPVTIEGRVDAGIMGLAPMAVVPARQRRGIGSALVRAGLERCREIGCRALVVLGHAAYYPRFGFVPASRFGIRCEYDVRDDVFMAIELAPGALGRTGGVVRYHAAFASL
jgi:putative acetyltransferase